MILLKTRIQNFLQQHYKTMLPFLVVGGSTFIIYFSLFLLLTKYLQLDYRIAVTIAYIIGVLYHFLSNRGLVFKAADRDIKHHIIKYSLVLILNYLVTLFILHATVNFLKLPSYFGIIFATGLTTISNYFLFKYWTFSTMTKTTKPI